MRPRFDARYKAWKREVAAFARECRISTNALLAILQKIDRARALFDWIEINDFLTIASKKRTWLQRLLGR